MQQEKEGVKGVGTLITFGTAAGGGGEWRGGRRARLGSCGRRQSSGLPIRWVRGVPRLMGGVGLRGDCADRLWRGLHCMRS